MELPKLTRQEMAYTMNMPEGQEYEQRPTGNNDYCWDHSVMQNWNWEPWIYRPVAPEGYEHIDEFRKVKANEFYISWGGFVCDPIQDIAGMNHWILKEKIHPGDTKQLIKSEEGPEQAEHEIKEILKDIVSCLRQSYSLGITKDYSDGQTLEASIDKLYFRVHDLKEN